MYKRVSLAIFLLFAPVWAEQSEDSRQEISADSKECLLAEVDTQHETEVVLTSSTIAPVLAHDSLPVQKPGALLQPVIVDIPAAQIPFEVLFNVTPANDSEADSETIENGKGAYSSDADDKQKSGMLARLRYRLAIANESLALFGKRMIASAGVIAVIIALAIWGYRSLHGTDTIGPVHAFFSSRTLLSSSEGGTESRRNDISKDGVVPQQGALLG